MISRFFKNDFLKKSFIYTIGVFAAGFLNYVFHFIVSRKLSVDKYGELQSIFALSAIAGAITAFVPTFIIKHVAPMAKNGDIAAGKSFLRWINKKIFTGAIIATIIFLMAMPWLREYLHLENFSSLIIIAVTLFITIITIGPNNVLMGWEDFIPVTITGFVGAAAKLAVGVFLASMFPASPVGAITLFVSGVVGYVLYKYFSARKFNTQQDFQNNKIQGETLRAPKGLSLDFAEKYLGQISFKKTILPVLFFSLFIILLQNIDVVLVKNLATSADAGYYGALKMLGAIILTINMAVIAVVFPNACANGAERKPANKMAHWGAYFAILLVSLPAIAIYAIVPKLIVGLLFGAKYAIFSQELWLFGLIALIFSLLNLEANFAFGRNDNRISWVLAITAIAMVAGIYNFHANIREIAWAINIAFGVGYVGTILLKFKRT